MEPLDLQGGLGYRNGTLHGRGFLGHGDPGHFDLALKPHLKLQFQPEQPRAMLGETHLASNEAEKYQPEHSQAVLGRHDLLSVCYAGFNFAASPLPTAVLPTAKNHVNFWLT